MKIISFFFFPLHSTCFDSQAPKADSYFQRLCEFHSLNFIHKKLFAFMRYIHVAAAGISHEASYYVTSIRRKFNLFYLDNMLYSSQHQTVYRELRFYQGRLSKQITEWAILWLLDESPTEKVKYNRIPEFACRFLSPYRINVIQYIGSQLSVCILLAKLWFLLRISGTVAMPGEWERLDLHKIYFICSVLDLTRRVVFFFVALR